ncbi:hypothetical protein [Myxococcus landrumensis]|uniref:Uncharacterized protein n=1 Tax=Myxococcus landrumensis TaxID=2813577 RepID=A0ABX7N3X1_9BACT|nr:hypothetical protein [Myxococcus landrumus]QSQ13439.1 hypothetical protein JY572_34695 [Myxococcus landrumus]
MATSKRSGAWRYKLGLGGSCESCGARLRRRPLLKDGQRVCPRCALLGKPKTLSDSAVHLGVEVGTSILGDLLMGMVLWTLAVVALVGGVMALLYLGVKHLQLPVGLTIILFAVPGLIAFLLLRRSR